MRCCAVDRPRVLSTPLSPQTCPGCRARTAGWGIRVVVRRGPAEGAGRRGRRWARSGPDPGRAAHGPRPCRSRTVVQEPGVRTGHGERQHPLLHLKAAAHRLELAGEFPPDHQTSPHQPKHAAGQKGQSKNTASTKQEASTPDAPLGCFPRSERGPPGIEPRTDGLKRSSLTRPVRRRTVSAIPMQSRMVSAGPVIVYVQSVTSATFQLGTTPESAWQIPQARERPSTHRAPLPVLRVRGNGPRRVAWRGHGDHPRQADGKMRVAPVVTGLHSDLLVCDRAVSHRRIGIGR